MTPERRNSILKQYQGAAVVIIAVMKTRMGRDTDQVAGYVFKQKPVAVEAMHEYLKKEIVKHRKKARTVSHFEIHLKGGAQLTVKRLEDITLGTLT